MHFDYFFVRIPPFFFVQVQYDPWPLRSITDYEVVETEVELLAPRAAAGQVVSGREFTEPVAVGRGDVASAPSDLACTTGKDTRYYSRLNVRASGAMYDLRLPKRVVANLKEGAVDAFWGFAVWSKSSRKVRLFLSTTEGKWSISDSIMVLQSFGGEPVPPEQCLAVQAELAARAGKQLGGRGLKRGHDEPAEVSATPAAPPTRKAPKPTATATPIGPCLTQTCVRHSDLGTSKHTPMVSHPLWFLNPTINNTFSCGKCEKLRVVQPLVPGTTTGTFTSPYTKTAAFHECIFGFLQCHFARTSGHPNNNFTWFW